MAPPDRIAGVILAAGASTRLGRPKQLLSLGGEPLIRHVIRRALDSRVDDVVVVLGAHADDVQRAIADLHVITVRNPEFAAGQSTSLRAGVAWARIAGVAAVVVLLGDQPEIETAFIDRVIETHRERGAPIVQALYAGTPGHPVLFALPLFAELETVHGDEGARSVIRRHAADLCRVRVADSPPPADIDTGADYQALLARWKRPDAGGG